MSSSQDDIFHFLAPEYAVYLRKNRKVVVTFHDLITLKDPQVNRLLAWQYRFPYQYIVKRADAVIYDSTQTYREVHEMLDVGDCIEKIIPLGVDERFKPISNENSEPFKLGYLGGFAKRKRVPKLITDFKHNASERMSLDIWGMCPKFGWKEKIIGTAMDDYDSIMKLIGDDKRIKYCGFAPENDIVKIYNSFDAFIFPSKYEGFGLPILEAVACGIPTFIYKDANIPDEVKKYAIMVESVKDIP
jgi:glycosyltransferase involved in cell wall biosynthesis